MSEVKKYGLSGAGSNLELGKGGPRVVVNGVAIDVKNAANNALANLRAASPVGDNDVDVAARQVAAQTGHHRQGRVVGRGHRAEQLQPGVVLIAETGQVLVEAAVRPLERLEDGDGGKVYGRSPPPAEQPG